MIFFICFMSIFIGFNSSHGKDNFGFLEEECTAATKEEPLVYRDDFPWDQSLLEILELESDLYFSGKRLPNRAFFSDSATVEFPFVKASRMGFNFSSLNLPKTWFSKIVTHIHKIQEKNYGEALIYSDIGHFHVFAPKEELEQVTGDKTLDSDNHDYYEEAFKSPNLKILYHTAEQLHVPQSEEELWRKNNRNILGDMKGEIRVLKKFTKKIEGHSQLFTFYINSSFQGCFKTKGRNFDLSLSSPK